MGLNNARFKKAHLVCTCVGPGKRNEKINSKIVGFRLLDTLAVGVRLKSSNLGSLPRVRL